MGTKNTEWRPGPTVCRCCLAEGCYKDISTEYFWMGKKEVYSEMLADTFDISIAYSSSGGPNSNSRLICEPCISRLRDASEFKRQVLECEKMFMQHLDPGGSSLADVEVNVEPLGKDVKIESIKQEKALSDNDDDFDDRPDFQDDDDDDDDDDLDNQPLTKFATKLPKKESVDILDLLDNAKVTEKRKSSSKTKASPSKKAKTKEAKPSASKTKPEKKKKADDRTYKRLNAKIMLECTTAYPFRLPEQSMMCVYCCEDYSEPAQFRKHLEDEHPTFKVQMAFAHVADGDIKVDCTDLRCRLCQKPFESLEVAASHLYEVHKRNLDLNYDLGIQPFMLGKKMSCAICKIAFPCLRSLSRHTQTHFLKYTCETCGKSYSTLTSLQGHVRYSHIGDERICRKCRKTFSTIDEKREHLKNSKLCCQHCCHICMERFPTWNMKQTHMNEVHGKAKRTYPCRECKLVFNTRDQCRIHFKTEHTEDHVRCTCGRKFDSELNLKKHMVIHTGEKHFQCSVCNKSFPRKANLRQHQWIHSEIKRFACSPCNKQFAQRVSWRIHMKSHHPESNANN